MQLGGKVKKTNAEMLCDGSLVSEAIPSNPQQIPPNLCSDFLSPASYTITNPQLPSSSPQVRSPAPKKTLFFFLSTFQSNMPVSASRAPAALFQVKSPPTDTRSATSEITTNNKDEEHADQSSIWAMIQSQNSSTPNAAAACVYPLMRRSSSLMSKSSLEMCTENLGSENGSGDFSNDDGGLFNSFSDDENVSVKQKNRQREIGDGEDGNKLLSVNYHCSVSRNPDRRCFPPPLPSISRHDGNFIQMRTHRQDGRLFVDAVPVASRTVFHARRQDGRLLLSFIHSTATTQPNPEKASQKINQSQEEAGDEEEDEEEVEMLDRGSMVEVKVSTQPQQKGSAKKLLRSSLVINKFVGGTPLTNQNRWAEPAESNPDSVPLEESQTPLSHEHRLAATTTAVAASSASDSSQFIAQQLPLADNKQLFTSNRLNREEMLHNMRRCSELRRPLSFSEGGFFATSS